MDFHCKAFRFPQQPHMALRLFPPAYFGNVEAQVYRSAFPTEINFAFLQTLNLKSVILLARGPESTGFSYFLEDMSIRTIQLENSVGEELDGSHAVSEEMVVRSLQALIDPANHPVLITCASGKYLTGAVIGCLRKMQHWALVSVFEEYRRFAGQRLHQEHEQFVELFDTDLVAVVEGGSLKFSKA